MIEGHPFGDAVPGEAVTIPDFNPTAGYQPRGRFNQRGDGKWIRVDQIAKEHPVTQALAERPVSLPKDQLELVRRTVANGATNDELALFLYDCERRGIHPLDKLLHFTKRGGKYTPVTSIDFMRAQAAMSGEMAGSEDPTFTVDGDKLVSATVTVYRITAGQRFPYTATARWSEYCPDNAPMWRRMPHTMLGKCAEALALRKAFPQQLAGLYSSEEMNQAGEPQGFTVEAPRAAGITPVPALLQPSTQSGGDSGGRSVRTETLEVAALSSGSKSDDGPNLGTAEPDDLPDGYRLIDDYRLDGDWHHITWGRDAQGGWTVYKTKLAKIGLDAKTAFTERMPVRLHSKKYPFLDRVERLGITKEQIAASKFTHDDPAFCKGCGAPAALCECR